jgi:hypothetical protein
MKCLVKRNSNNKIDKVYAPNGEPSKLYDSILNRIEGGMKVPPSFSDIAKDDSNEELALSVYSNVFTDNFNNWFDNSVVRDDNGEPILVYHGTTATEAFDTFIPGSSDTIFFTDDIDYAGDVRSNLTVLDPFFLKIENPKKEERELDNDVAYEVKKENKYDGIIGKDFGQDINEGNTYVIFNPNQVKSIFNLDFSNVNNIYYNTTNNDNNFTEKQVNKFNDLLVKFGFKLEDLDTYKANYKIRNNTKLEIGGLINFFDKIVAYKKGDTNVLAEESTHLIIELSERDAQFNKALELVELTQEFQDQYSDLLELYKDTKNPDYTARKEILGQLLMKYIANDSNILYRLKRLLKWRLNKFLEKLNVKYLNELDALLYGKVADFNKRDYSKFNLNNIDTKVLYNSVNLEKQKLEEGIKTIKERIRRLEKKRINPGLASRLKFQQETLEKELANQEYEVGIVKFVEYLLEDMKEIDKYVQDMEKKGKIFTSDQLKHIGEFVEHYHPYLRQLNYLVKRDQVVTNNKDKVHNEINKLISSFDDISIFFSKARKESNKEILRKDNIKTGFEVDYNIDEIFDTIPQDAWSIQTWLGGIKDVSNPILRVIYGMIGRAKAEISSLVANWGKDLIKKNMIDLGVNNTSKFADTMEIVDEKGNKKTIKSGYYLTQYKLGEFYKAYDDFVANLKEEFNLEEDQREPLDRKDREAYNNKINDWLEENTERRFLPEYYNLFNALSLQAREQLRMYDLQIFAILNEVKNEDGVFELENLSASKWKTLQEYKSLKKGLYSDYYADGTLKSPTSVDGFVAQELQKYQELRNNNVKYNQDKEAFEREKERKQKELSSGKFQQWLDRNTETNFKQKFWDMLDKIVKKNYGLTYENLGKERRGILNRYRDNNGEFNYAIIPEESKKRIREIDDQMAVIRKNMRGRKLKGLKFSDIATIVPTKYYARELVKAELAGKKEEFLNEHTYLDKDGNNEPYSYFTTMVPNDKKLIETIPSKEWSSVSPESAWYNPNFNEDWEGMQPSSKYNNQAYDNLSANEKEVLNNLIEEKRKIDRLLPLPRRNAYLLPQISQGLLDMFGNRDVNLKNVGELLKDAWQTRVDDKEFGDKFADENIPNREDGTRALNVPLQFVRKLENTDNVSTDIYSSMILYYKMAKNFEKMSKLAPDVEQLKEELGDIKYVNNKGEAKKGIESNLYKMLTTYMEMQLYGIQKERTKDVNMLGVNINPSKAASNANSWVRASNLMLNFFTTLSGQAAGTINNILDTFVGRHVNFKSQYMAARELKNNIHQAVIEFKSKKKQNKLNLMLEYFEIMESLEDTFDNLDKNKLLRITNKDLVYSTFKFGDYFLKSQIMLAVAFNYRYHPGTKKFYNYKDFQKLKSEDNFWQLKSMYDMYNVKDYKLVRDDKVTNEVEAAYRYTVNKIVANAEGSLNELDRTKLHQSAIGQLATTHRGFLIDGLAKRFKARGVNYINGEVEVGFHRSFVTEFLPMLGKSVLNVKRMSDLRNVFDMWGELDIYQKEAAIKSLAEMAMVTAVAVAAYALNSWSDDDEDNYVLEFMAYTANRVLIETSALSLAMIPTPNGISIPYYEITTILNSPVAGTRQLESIVNLTDILMGGETIERGPYEGFTKRTRTIAKIAPGVKGLFQTRDPDSANNYIKNKTLTWLYD